MQAYGEGGSNLRERSSESTVLHWYLFKLKARYVVHCDLVRRMLTAFGDDLSCFVTKFLTEIMMQ